jgi:hypothetical protein
MRLEWTGVGHEVLPVIWNTVSPFILEAWDHHGYNAIDPFYYWEKILKEEMQLWVLFDAEDIRGVLLTEVSSFGGEKVCNIPVCGGGEAEEWVSFMTDVLEPWCKEQQVDRIEFRTRKASQKFLARHDYYVSDITLTKRLNRMEH